jgi:hypothetical protein
VKASLQIHVDSTKLSRTAGGSIVGPIWVELADTAFPEEGWFDFPVVLLTWWLQALRAHGKTHSDKVLDFMDGPYEIRLEAASGGCRARLYDRHGQGKVVAAATVDCEGLGESALAQGKKILAQCRRNGWEDTDVAALASEIDARSESRH